MLFVIKKGRADGHWQYALQQIREAWGRGEYTVMVTRRVTWFHKRQK